MADKFNMLELSSSMSYQEIKTKLRKQKQLWTTRESNGSDKIRRDAEAMTDLISQLRELLEQLPEDSNFIYADLATYAVFLEMDDVNMEKAVEMILQADSGDLDVRTQLGVLLLAAKREDLAEEWVPNIAAAAREAEARKEKEAAEARRKEEEAAKARRAEEAARQQRAQSSTKSTGSSSSSSTSSTSSTSSSVSTTGSYNYTPPVRRSHKFRNFVIFVALVLAALAFFGEEKGHPIHNAQVLVQKLLHRDAVMDSAEEPAEDQTSIESENVQIPEPTCLWDMTRDLSEVYGYQSDPYGDVQVVDVLGDGSLLAASFDGDGDYLDLGRAYNMSESFTLNVVLCCLDTQKDYSAFFAKYETSGEGPYAYSVNQGHVNCWVSTEAGSINANSQATVEPGYWYLISIVRDGDSLKLYVNGEEDTVLDISGGVFANEDLVTVGRQAYLFDPVDDLQFTGYIRHMDLYTQTLSQDLLRQLFQEQQVAQLPALRGLRTLEADVPLWGETGDGGYEVLAYLPRNTVAVFLEDVNEDYVRVSWHGLYGNVDRSLLEEVG